MNAPFLKPRPTLRDVVLDAAIINPVAFTICKSMHVDGLCVCERLHDVPCEKTRVPAVHAVLVAMAAQRERR